MTRQRKTRFSSNKFLVLFFTLLVASRSFAQATKAADRHVNAKAAVHIAEAELVRVYGSAVKSEQPFTAKLENGAWTVVGTRWCQEQLPDPNFYCQGGHWAVISKDGRVLAAGGQAGHVRK